MRMVHLLEERPNEKLSLSPGKPVKFLTVPAHPESPGIETYLDDFGVYQDLDGVHCGMHAHKLKLGRYARSSLLPACCGDDHNSRADVGRPS